MTLIPVPHMKLDVNKLPDTLGRFGSGLLNLARGIRNVFDARKVTDLAADLMSLAFWHDGMRQEIGAIAQGKATQETMDRLGAKLEETRQEVSGAIERLTLARNTWISERFSADIAGKVDELIELKVGAGYIRDQLAQIVQRGQNPEIENEADYLVRQIEYFNASLFALHEIVRKRNLAAKPSVPKLGKPRKDKPPLKTAKAKKKKAKVKKTKKAKNKR